MGKQRDIHDITDRRVALYCRVSDDRDGQSRSVDDQEAIGHRWVEAGGGKLAQVYRDSDRSASVFATKPREHFLRLSSDVEADRIDVLWFWEISRAARDMRVFSNFLHDCGKHGVVWSVNGTMYDPTRTDDVLTLTMLAAVAQSESGKISDRTKRGHASAAAAGRPTNRIPYGYKRIYDPVTRDFVRQEANYDSPTDRPEDAPARVVAEIFASIARGRSLHGVANDLNNRGVPAPASQYWGNTKVRRIAERPTYIGVRVHQGEPLDGVEGDWPPLVDEDVYWQVQRILRGNHGDTQWRPGAGKTLLSFIARCWVCGQRLQAIGGGRSYSCVSGQHVGVTCDRLDTAVTEVVLEMLTDPKQYEQWSQVDDSAEVVAARAAADKARVELEEWRRLAGTGEYDPVVIANATKRVVQRIDEAETVIRDAAVPPVVRGHAGPHARETWETLELDARRALVRALLDVEVLPVGRGSRAPIQDRVRLTQLTSDDPPPVLPPAPIDWPTKEDRERQFDERHQRAAELHAQGKTWVDIGADMGVSPVMARRYALRLRASDTETTLDEIKSKAADRRAQVVKLRNEGMTYAAIAREVGVSAACVRLDVQKAREEGETVQ